MAPNILQKVPELIGTINDYLEVYVTNLAQVDRTAWNIALWKGFLELNTEHTEAIKWLLSQEDPLLTLSELQNLDNTATENLINTLHNFYRIEMPKIAPPFDPALEDLKERIKEVFELLPLFTVIEAIKISIAEKLIERGYQHIVVEPYIEVDKELTKLNQDMEKLRKELETKPPKLRLP